MASELTNDFKIDNSLAIIIPAYKSNYLKLALQSIAAQTDKRFNVYIGDDASPEGLEEICLPFQSHFSLTYKKFPDNLGGTSLVSQWNRCIQLSQEEPWIWIFSDDDVMQPDCIKMFYQALEQTPRPYEVYRFNLDWIDGNDKIIHTNAPHPTVETAFEFAVRKLKFETHTTACEYIFSRKAFNQKGGIVDFPLAWCSDDATWIKLSEQTGIYTIPYPKVQWRYSGLNISSQGEKLKEVKIDALLKYLRWLNDWAYRNEVIANANDAGLKEIEKEWLWKQLETYQSFMSVKQCAYIAKRASELWRERYFTNFIQYLSFNIYFLINSLWKGSVLQKVFQFPKRVVKRIIRIF